ncbi:MAG: FAD-dependent oxidoreductase [Halioglobus sp.]
MKRWNGWGDDDNALDYALSASALGFLASLIGKSAPLPDASLEQVLARVPASRLPPHALYSLDAQDRVRHARGQSLPDWLALRSGEFGMFPDGVAFPDSSAAVRDLLQHAADHQIDVIPYGGGTSVVGHINPVDRGRPVLTVDMTRMNKLMHLDRESQIATFGAGTVGPRVEAQLAAEGYTLGHYPQSWELSTIGGWVASRPAASNRCAMAGSNSCLPAAALKPCRGRWRFPPSPPRRRGPTCANFSLEPRVAWVLSPR